ncbi:hypothetical protein GCM10010401_09460 [Rarobacter faecitabidus]|uniref:ATP-dependent Lhr-like helicase n=1 Tax=Rarobacter faecitabidus TaxID=13243 RepID=A0A542ZA58_RARFA|nr:DEAD/DEAH box helicase [Rarobacter faecitabidus]TQL57229.1 ATP-dependent Lhr-like helicase [Rarobacter faecitabidus]
MTFSRATQGWLDASFDAPTPAQRAAWQTIGEGNHTLVIAPTGSGKTLAAFLWAIDQHVTAGDAPAPQILYISPLKALASDVERNLRAPLIGIAREADRLGLPIPEVSVGIRTGDTSPRDRQRMAKQPPDIIITTPESLFLMLTSSASAALERVGTVIVDEIHALAGTKRGAHLSLSLERLDALLPVPAQRIGLSATVTPAEKVAEFLSGARLPDDGGRPTRVVKPPTTKHIDLGIEAVDPTVRHLRDDVAGGRDGALLAEGHAMRPAGATLGRDDAMLPGNLGEPAGGSSARRFAEEDLSGDASGGYGPGAYEPVAYGQSQAGAPEGSSLDPRGGGSTWPEVERRVVDLIEQHRSTLVFVNSRRTAEKLTARLNEEWARRTGATNALGDSALDNTSQWPAAITAQAGAALGIEPIVARAHHGSMSRVERTQIEDALKSGRLPAVVATSSLELGIDMGAIDLVIQIGAPPSVASGLQRIGRAGHQVGQTSHGVMLTLHRGELIPAAVTAQRMRERKIEPVHDLTNPLDVLAQQVVAAVAVADWHEGELQALVRRAAPFTGLGDSTWASVLDMLAGRYPSEDFSELRPRLTWDRATGMLSGRRGSALIAVTSGGTIPDRGLYPVVLAGSDDGPRKRSNRVGELDEEMVFESRVGDAITLGSSTWRIEEITPQQVIVTPAPGQPGRLPFWKGDGPGRPFPLGAAVGAFTRRIDAERRRDAVAARGSLAEQGLDESATDQLLALLAEQHESTGRIPDDKTLIVERFHDELGDWRIVVHSPFGSRVHAPWALVIGARIREHFGLDASVSYSDDGIVLRMPPMGDADEPGLPVADLLIDPAEVFAAVREQITGSPMFAARFREAAARALLLPRRNPGMRQPLWQQRHRAAQLLAVAAQYPDFPIVIEAVRECLRDDFDLPALTEIMGAVEAGRIRLLEVTTDSPSPFARSLLFSYTAQFMYDADAPLAERKAVALSLDPVLLAEILGDDDAPDLADLLDPEVVQQVSDEVQRTAPDRRVKNLDGLWDLLRSHGPLTRAELAARVSPEVEGVDEWLRRESGRLVFSLRRPRWHGNAHVAEGANGGDGGGNGPDADQRADASGNARAALSGYGDGNDSGDAASGEAGADDGLWWAATDDAARLRDGLGLPLPAGIAQAFLEPVDDPLGDLARRYARTHGPFTVAELARGLALGTALASEIVRRLAGDGKLVLGPARRVAIPADPAPTATNPEAIAEPADGQGEGSAVSSTERTATWIDADVLRRIRRRTLAVLRGQVEAVTPDALARFVPTWQHLDGTLRGTEGVLQVIEQLAGARFPASALETFILPARVGDYEPRFLDDLAARGEIIWCGHQSLPGARGDGIISLHLTETASLTLPVAPSGADADAGSADDPGLVAVVMNALRRGGQFFDALLADAGAPASEVADVVWQLAWSSRATSDSFGSLREMIGARGGAHRSAKSAGRPRPGRGLRGLRALAHSAEIAAVAPSRTAASASAASAAPPATDTAAGGEPAASPASAAATTAHHPAAGPVDAGTTAGSGAISATAGPVAFHPTPGPPAPHARADHSPTALRDILAARAGGRWSALPLPDPADPGYGTLRAHADITVLLQRYGVVARTPGLADQVTTDAATMYRILAEFEQQGSLRRGYFVEGLGGAQFALPGAVDELRRFASASVVPDARVIAATDPANPYGVLLEWPAPILAMTGGVDSASADVGAGAAHASKAPTTASASTHSKPALGTSHRPGRRAGAVVVLVDGIPVFYLERGGRTLVVLARDISQRDVHSHSGETYLDATNPPASPFAHAAKALVDAVRAGTVSRATIRQVSDMPALDALGRTRNRDNLVRSPVVQAVHALLAAGAQVHTQGLRLEGPRARG